MKELERSSGDGNINFIYKAVPELNLENVKGFFEQWYSGDYKWRGVRVGDAKKLAYAEIVSKGQGLPLGEGSFYGIHAQDRFYDGQSFLVNGSILTASKRREYFRGKEGLRKIKVSENMPKQIVSILAETEERVLETARLLRLPL